MVGGGAGGGRVKKREKVMWCMGLRAACGNFTDLLTDRLLYIVLVQYLYLVPDVPAIQRPLYMHTKILPYTSSYIAL